MRGYPRVDSSSDESSIRSDVDGPMESDTDLSDPDECAYENDENDENDKQCESAEDEAWPSEDHPPEYYHEQLESFDEEEFTKQDYKDSSTRLLDRMEDQWNQ